MNERAVCGLISAIFFVVINMIFGVFDFETLTFGACGCFCLAYVLRGAE